MSLLFRLHRAYDPAEPANSSVRRPLPGAPGLARDEHSVPVRVRAVDAGRSATCSRTSCAARSCRTRASRTTAAASPGCAGSRPSTRPSPCGSGEDEAVPVDAGARRAEAAGLEYFRVGVGLADRAEKRRRCAARAAVERRARDEQALDVPRRRAEAGNRPPRRPRRRPARTPPPRSTSRAHASALAPQERAEARECLVEP